MQGSSHPLNTFRLLLSYDGTSFFGWQKTKSGPSIEENLEIAIYRVTQEKVKLDAASRTDRGVHAEGQVVIFSLQKEFSPFSLLKALNAHLCHEIRVKEVDYSVESFHPSLNAKSKEYHYYISNQRFPIPMRKKYIWHYPQYVLDIPKMKWAANQFIGAHDFRFFTTIQPKNPICHLSHLEIVEGDEIVIKMVGDRFLYKMARTLAGTLLYIGANKLDPSIINELFIHKKRALAGMTAPAHGLFLHRVIY